MPDFDIDNIKQQWQQQDVEPKYEDADILQMLNQKSRNYVKYVFWISAVEFALLLLLNVYYVFQVSDDESLTHIIERMGLEKTYELEMDFAHLYFVLKIAGLAITGFFAVAFYLSYKRIKVEENLKSFIIRIIKFRKTVNLFILMNILLLVSAVTVFGLFISKTLSEQNLELQPSTLIGFVVGLAVAMALGISIIWIYYRIVYGIFLRKLNKNLKQLKEIEEDNVGIR